jgi:hypothetical protein
MAPLSRVSSGIFAGMAGLDAKERGWAWDPSLRCVRSWTGSEWQHVVKGSERSAEELPVYLPFDFSPVVVSDNPRAVRRPPVLSDYFKARAARRSSPSTTFGSDWVTQADKGYQYSLEFLDDLRELYLLRRFPITESVTQLPAMDITLQLYRSMSSNRDYQVLFIGILLPDWELTEILRGWESEEHLMDGLEWIFARLKGRTHLASPE